ncbi:MAG: hypothetical protein MR304_04760 [Eubacterium sp.]|nr:hypothetical protein [Eubacterium sp.]
MQRKKLMGVLALILCFGMIVPSMRAQAATTISSGSSSSGLSGSSSSGSSSSGSTSTICRFRWKRLVCMRKIC